MLDSRVSFVLQHNLNMWVSGGVQSLLAKTTNKTGGAVSEGQRNCTTVETTNGINSPMLIADRRLC